VQHLLLHLSLHMLHQALLLGLSVTPTASGSGSKYSGSTRGHYSGTCAKSSLLAKALAQPSLLAKQVNHSSLEVNHALDRLRYRGRT
jgi:hypothetical protein